MRRLLATTCLSSSLLFAAPAMAQTQITDARTTPVTTAGQNLTITSTGSVKPTTGTAVTIDSDNTVSNAGTVQITGANNSTGILAQAGRTGSITNTGTITLDENYTPTDTDSDGDIDGTFAQGSGRFGIRTAGAFTGDVSSTGTITIEGNNSAGIALDGPLTGKLTTGGTIIATGDNSFGVRAGDISGNVRLAGAVGAKGANSVGAAMDGDIGGQLVIQGNIGATGYRSTTPPSDTSKLDADDLLQGGPALRITGNVAGGIVFAVPPADSNADDTDEDDDGLPDATEGSALVNSFGAAPAVQIGGAEDITIGAVAGNANGHGLVMAGTVTGDGVYKDVAGNGLVIGGQGGDVTIAGGMTLNGNVGAASNAANATAVRLGAGANVAEIRVGGNVVAQGGAEAADVSTGIAIDAGANVQTIRNTGSIRARGSGEATGIAIIDRAGTVTLVENAGIIEATGAAAGKGVAIDLSASTGGVTIRQPVAAEGKSAGAIVGDIKLGGGADLVEIADGSMRGNATFGAGANRLAMTGDAVWAGNAAFGASADTMTLGGTSVFAGNADFGGGADSLTLSGTARFAGSITGGGGLAVNVGSGTLDVSNGGAVALGSLSVGSGGTIGVSIDAEAGTNTLYDVAGAATFAQDSRLIVHFANVSGAEGTYTIIRAGDVVGGSNLGLAETVLPFIFDADLTTDDTANTVALTVDRKDAGELGLNRSQASAWDAVFAALDSDEQIADIYLAVADSQSLQAVLSQMLPDHAGGAFETVTAGSRAVTRILADPRMPIADAGGGLSFWVQQVAWGSSKSLGDTASYDVNGWGASGGAELDLGGVGKLGASIAYLAGNDDHGDNDNTVKTGQYEGAVHWRGSFGGANAWVRGSYARIDFDEQRNFVASLGGDAVTRQANGAWNGTLMSAGGGLSYELRAGKRLSLRPAVAFDYYRLKEDGYTETGGGDAFNLTVDERTSDEAAVSAALTVGYDFGGTEPGGGFFRLEAEGGRREIVGGELGATTARFADGDPFILVPEERTSGFTGRLRLLGGDSTYILGGEVSAEEQQDHVALAARVSFQFGF
ncbi:autotransporter domain-containing protein [Sphingomonas gilva]|uniref:Autotransporter domain-containing protein n=1 Tax=Sphingomonas gilva TaxID=2305907 RepID=A0A396RNP2_9SPHN|nr:autotransporter outer membrane beta-barrel domain-containing protein [Sphingomonas gilva]RHW18127.1 autotransporter domain-containing protein [Sphingomonas gilva]